MMASSKRLKKNEAVVNHQMASKLNLLQLPSEILLIIAEFLLNTKPQNEYSTTLFWLPDFSHLLSLSLVHSRLRKVCFVAGLFDRIKPKGTDTYAYGFWEYKLQRLLRPFCPTSLGVDVGEPKLWNLYAKIMRQIPSLDELRVGGVMPEYDAANALCRSDLSKAFRRFKGSTLVLENTCFSDENIPILLNIGCDGVTKLNLVRCQMHVSAARLMEPDIQNAIKTQPGRVTPLCPRVEVFSCDFGTLKNDTGDLELVEELRIASENVGSIGAFSFFFLINADHIQHVGLGSGCRPRLSKYRDTEWDELYPVDEKDFEINQLCNLPIYCTFAILRWSCCRSLLSFTDYDGMNGPFLEDSNWRYNEDDVPWVMQTNHFEKVRLLTL